MAAVAHDRCSLRLLLLMAAAARGYYRCTWLMPLMAAAAHGCYSWLLLMAAADHGCKPWLLLLMATARGCTYSWLLLLMAAAPHGRCGSWLIEIMFLHREACHSSPIERLVQVTYALPPGGENQEN